MALASIGSHRVPCVRYIPIVAMVVTIVGGFSEQVCAASSLNGAPEGLNCAAFADPANLPSPAPQTDPEAIQRYQEINEQTNAASHRVLFLGDSLTQKWDPSIWTQHFAPVGAMNAGVNGDRTENVLWRIEHSNI